MQFKINKENQTIEVSMYASTEVLKQANIAAKNHGYTLVVVMARMVSPIRKVA